MQIKAVKFNEKGFMTQPFAFGGEEDMERFDAAVRYRSCLQNYVIDTGSEVPNPEGLDVEERRRQYDAWLSQLKHWKQ